MAIEAVIFDFDGTLADSMGVWEQIDIEFFGKYNLPLTRENTEVITTLGFEGGSKFVREVLGLNRTEQEIVDEWNDMAVPHYAHDVSFKPGAREFLEWLGGRGIPMGICTSNQRRLVNATLENNDAMHFFSHMTCTNEVGLPKRDPEAFLHASRAMGVDPATTLVLEDTAPCAAAAREAGFTVIGVLDGHVQQDVEGLRAACDIFIESFDELSPASDLSRKLF